MKTRFGMAMLGFCTLVVAIQEAHAQLPQTSVYRAEQAYAANRATTSPYLNLLNQQTGIDGSQQYATTYYGLVRPQLDQRRIQLEQQQALAKIQQNVQQVQAQLSRTGMSRPQTGHSSRFMSFSHYYPTMRPPVR